jgi:alpha-galactosidase
MGEPWGERHIVPGVLPGEMFSFLLDGEPGQGVLDSCEVSEESRALGAYGTEIATCWQDTRSGLRVDRTLILYDDFRAAEWLLRFTNTGDVDTPIISDLWAADFTIRDEVAGDDAPYKLHTTVGAPSDPTDFTASVVDVGASTHTIGVSAHTMGGQGGRSSNADLPFFKIETGTGSLIVAVGWSGQWTASVQRTMPVARTASVSSPNEGDIRVTAGMERTHFRLHPGESVRMPRMLILWREGDTWEANAEFRQLIGRHYAARRDGELHTDLTAPTPTFFCNTCFTRKGHWLNECNEENQVSLIDGYKPPRLDAFITDAGWFEGGWPDGAGNWTPRKDAYPQGMAPVAKAAMDQGATYGLWFEPERVTAGSWLHQNRPEWLLSSEHGPHWTGSKTYLLNLGLEEVREFMLSVLEEFLQIPGFEVYRQDFNVDPLEYWRDADAEDRQGITEIKYLEGLYAYWEEIARRWPTCLIEECASGGRRIDLETVMRMHIHQKTDYWFDDDVDQASVWGLSQYLPNNVFVAHLDSLDTYSFHSTMASSLCVGWIADDPEFDIERAKEMAVLYREVRHLFTGAWYPLLPQTRDESAWMASQYHRPDLNEGLVLAFRHAESPYPAVEVAFRGLDESKTYELTYSGPAGVAGDAERATGAELMERFVVGIPQKRGSVLVRYGAVG